MGGMYRDIYEGILDQLQPAIENEDLKINKCPVEVYNCNCRVFIWQKEVKSKKELTTWYCDVPIEFFFQIEFSWLHRNGKSEQDCELELI